ncbi:MAG: transcriptional regulator [Candidatus Aminicenantes bacterium]|nr:transcriptional regulator [Candidatus Aminicenantes bacterium]
MNEIQEIARLLAGTDDEKTIERFIKEILTPTEIKEVSGRWALVKLLEKGESQRTIARKLGMSLCKITRGSRELKKKNSALKKMIKKIQPPAEKS